MYVTVPKAPPLSSTRISLGAVLLQVAVAIVWPIWGVEFVHILVADALTSSALLLYQLEMSICLLLHGDFFGPEPRLDSYCSGPNSEHDEIMKPIMYALPFWIRLVQCIYKFFETRKTQTFHVRSPHLINAAKYFSGIMVIVFSSLKTLKSDVTGFQPQQVIFFWIVSLVVKTLFCFIWDILMDWDLGQITAKDSLLRPIRIFPRWTYYVLMVFNALGRCSWSFALSMNTLPAMWDPLMAVVEVVRRSVWFVFRVENEYLKVLQPNGALITPVAARVPLLLDDSRSSGNSMQSLSPGDFIINPQQN